MGMSRCNKIENFWKVLFFKKGTIVKIKDLWTKSAFNHKYAKIVQINEELEFPVIVRPWDDLHGEWDDDTVPVLFEEIEPVDLDEVEEGDPCYG